VHKSLILIYFNDIPNDFTFLNKISWIWSTWYYWTKMGFVQCLRNFDANKV